MKKMMRRLATAALLAAVTAATPRVWAQSDAAAAYQQGKTAFQAGQYDKAREQFAQASQTDPKNPEVFLWLGKAQYQLGHIDEAVTAWNTTLTLAPNEPYAAQMLKALRGDVGDAESTLGLAEVLVKEGLHEPALVTLEKLLRDKALTDAQRSRALTMRAGALLETGRFVDAEAAIQEVLVKYPKLADAEQTTFLLAKAKLRKAGREAEGVALLKKLAAEHAESPWGIGAQFELIAFDLSQGITAAKADELAKWVAAHPEHAMAHRARALLVDSDLAVAASSGEATPDSPLSAYDKAALAVADDLVKRTVRADEAARVTQQIVTHLEAYYGKAKAYGAAIAGTETLLKSPLPPSSRLMALRALAGFQTELAVQQITEAARANKLAAGAMPKSLADAVATVTTITTQFPADGGWRLMAALADRVRAAGSEMPWPATVTDLKPAQAWAVEIALPVVRAASDSVAAEAAAKLILAIVEETWHADQPGAHRAALRVNGLLVAALPTRSPLWATAMFQQADLLDTVAAIEFRENIRAGKPEANAQLSDAQTRFLGTLGTIVTVDAKQTPGAIQKLEHMLTPWLAAGHYAVAEQAYAELTKAAPESQQRQVRLAAISIWVRQANDAAQRLATAGQAEPHKLDPSLAKALQALYAMQAGVENTDPFLAQVRAEIDRIVNHYKQIKYFDVADLAMKEKGGQANPQGEAYSQFQLAVLADEGARREIVALLKQYKATDKLALTDATKAAIAAYEKFITDHATDPLAMHAVEAVFAIAGSFEQYAAYDVAAGIDRDFAAFAAKTPVLAQAAPGNSSVAERALFGAVTVVDVKARAAMAKSMAKSAAENKGNAVPPAKISEEFAAAIAAYKDFIKASPQSPLINQAILRINAIALDYARADAWDVAEGIYSGLLADKLASRDPERIEFSRGLCEIGKVMPEHAKEVLAALLQPEHGAGSGVGDEINGMASARLPQLDKASEDLKKMKGPFQPGISGGGGFGAGGGADSERFKGLSGITADAAKPAERPASPPASSLHDMTFGGVAAADQRSQADAQALAAISRQEARRANQIASLRDRAYRTGASSQPMAQQSAGQNKLDLGQQAGESVPVLSEEELARQQAALDTAYKIFQEIRTKYAETSTAEQARAEIVVEMNYWRGIAQWQRAAAMGEKFLIDNPTDHDLPQLRLAIASDHLAWASQKLDALTTSQEMLAEVSKRFNMARAELAKITTDFPDERPLVEDAQWRIATSFLTQARTVDGFSATLARGQYVRAAKELRRVAGEFAQNPQIANIPQMLWDISMELHNRGYHEDSLSVWNIIAIDYPVHPLAQQALVMTAQTYQAVLGRPLRAAEVYLEINFEHGGNDPSMQSAVFAIGADLKNQKRWIESLRVLESFVQSFPRNAQAGQALTMIGQIHQANEAWKDAIIAYRRVIDEFPAAGQWVQDAKWSIADCTINLSQWRPAIGAYESYVASFPKDAKLVEANRRIGVLKDLANYQKLVDENGPKAYDAQFQIASIVTSQLGNWRKGVEEYQKVATNWPKSHLAADALHSIGLLYLQNGEVDAARVAFRAVPSNYPDSPYACDSLFQVGKSYEDEANRLTTVTREVTWELNKDIAQKQAYANASGGRAETRRNLASKVQKLKEAGKKELAELQMAQNSGNLAQNDDANFLIAAENAKQEQENMTANQLADRQDKINAALRKAVAAYAEAAKIPAGDKAGEALLHMAVIFNDRLGEAPQAMSTWLEIVRQFSGTAVAEEASWQIAQHYEKAGQFAEAVDAYKSFLRNYRRSPKASEAQFFIAENYEHLGQWISAMDQYTNYVQNFPEGTLIQKAKEQISFIKTYRL